MATDWLFEMAENRSLAEMVDHKEVPLVETGVENSRQNRLVVRQELCIFLACSLWLKIRILLLNDLDESADIDVVHLGDRHVDESL